MSAKTCKSVACASRGVEIQTDEEKCLLCGKPLEAAFNLADLLGGLFGNK